MDRCAQGKLCCDGGRAVAREVNSVTDIIPMSCSHLCHGSCGFTAAAWWKGLSYLAHAEPLMSQARVKTMEAYVAKSKARLALKCNTVAIKVKDTIQSSGVVSVYFFFVLELSFLLLTLSNWVSTVLREQLPKVNKLTVLNGLHQVPQDWWQARRPDTGRNKSAWLSSLLPSLFAVWLVQSIDCAAPVLLADPVGCAWAAGVPSVRTYPWANHGGIAAGVPDRVPLPPAGNK